MKLNRKYRLAIQGNDGDWIIIEPPLTIKININRGIQASLNTMDLDIHNLKEATRDKIFQDKFVATVYRKIILQAGYGDELFAIFTGNIFTANSLRSNTEIITRITATDGGYDTNGTLSFKTLPPGTTKEEFINALVSDFSNVKKAVFTKLEGDFPRGVVINDNTFFLIKKYTNGKAYVDLEKLYILNDDEVVNAFVPVIDLDTGLLGTPMRRDNSLVIKTIFSPEMIIGQLIEVRSKVQPNPSQYNGQWKINGLQHQGIISDSQKGQCISTFDLFVGTQVFGKFNAISA